LAILEVEGLEIDSVLDSAEIKAQENTLGFLGTTMNLIIAETDARMEEDRIFWRVAGKK
jgi:hypothetical protein